MSSILIKEVSNVLKIYKRANGRTYQFEETEAPEDAVLVEPKKAETKAVKPANKKRKAETK